MPIGTHHIVEGTIIITPFGYGIEMDGGGTWQLDCRPSPRRYFGARVIVEGARTGYCFLALEKIKCLDGSVDERPWIVRTWDRLARRLNFGL